MKKVLIAMCVYHTEENDRLPIIVRTLLALSTCLKPNHRLFIYDNSPNSIITDLRYHIEVVWSGKADNITFLGGDGINIGTARGINECWKHHEEGEYLMKVDDDYLVKSISYINEMVEVMERTPNLGILALKRKDLTESPNHESIDYRTKLMMVPQKKGERWYVIEQVKNVFGTVQMYSPELFKRIGYMEQVGPYGWDDFIMSVKCYAAGMIGAFLPHVEIDHIDEGEEKYVEWKREQAAKVHDEVMHLAKQYKLGLKELYYDGGFKEQGT